MKSVNAAVSDSIRTDYDVQAVPRLTVEWNWNRYASTVQVDNDPSDDLEGYDIEMFPVESLIQPNRPTAGIIKALVGEARVADEYSQYDGKSRSARYYVASVDDLYKYWKTPYQTDGTGTFPTQTDGITSARPHVSYPDGVAANKIVVGFEDTWAQPDVFEIRVQNSSGTWTIASSAPTINSSGQSILYWNGSNWSSAQPADQSAVTIIYGVQVRITSMRGVPGGAVSGAYQHANVIEISARREHDLTDRLVQVGDNFEMAAKSFIYPIGTVTANTGQVSLWNGDGEFNENTTGLYQDLIEPNAVFNLEYVYTINGMDYPVQQFKLYGGPFNGQRSDTATVDLTDYSKYFQEIKPQAAMYQGLTVAEIIWRICDSVGFVDYEIQFDDVTTQHKLPIWWCDGEKTVWQLFDELAQATQTAIYFDGFGKLQIRSRTNAFNDARTPDWTLRGRDVGTDLADIATIAQTDELESNKVTVNFQKITIDPVVNGQQRTQVLWKPDGTVALRADPLYRDLGKTDDLVFINPGQARIWPYSGMLNIEGELISYDGKKFTYWDSTDANPQYKTVTVNSQDEYEKYNTKTVFVNRYKNHFTGALAITERGVWNSENKAHTINANGYSARHIVNGNHATDVYGFYQAKHESRVYLHSGPHFDRQDDLLIVTHGLTVDEGYYQMGTRLRFESDGRRSQRAGIVFNAQAGIHEDGYYIELQPSSHLQGQKQRARRNELVFYTRVNGNDKKLGPNNGRGVPLPIVQDAEYEIDIDFSIQGGNHIINVWVNGRICMTVTVSGSDQNPFGGRFGMFARGDTKASYEYLYGISRIENQPEDDFSFLDKVNKGYTGSQWDREWVYRYKTERRRVKKSWTKEKVRWNQQFFDDFGPYVHEVRQYDVKFTQAPAITSRLFLSNDYTVICPEYRGNSFNASFYIANTTRMTAIANGEDSAVYAGSGQSVNQIMAVIGRSITTADSDNVVSTDTDQVRARGVIESEISSPWIQSESMAQEIADWIKGHWSKGADEQTVTVFGNPLLEIGDVVTIDYPEADMNISTHKYFVTSTQTTFDTGMETVLVLRRVV